MSAERVEILKGTLDMMVLQILLEEPRHGYGITRRLQELTDEALRVDEGSMYPALYRMEKRGLIESDWFLTDNNRRARIYRLTPAGEKQLHREATHWQVFSKAVGKVLALNEGASS